MIKPVTAAMLVCLSSTVAFAAETANPADKAAKDMPETTAGGTTANPTAKADAPTANPADKMKADEGAGSGTSGSTAMPNAKPDPGSIPKSQNEGDPGAQK